MNASPKVSEMVVSCSAMGCTNRQGDKPNLAFHSFPRNDVERRYKWTSAIRRKYWEPGPYARVCGEHFIRGKKSDHPHHPDYVPSLFSFSPPTARAQGLKKLERFLRHAEINKKKSNNKNGETVATARPDLQTSEAKADVSEPMDQNPPCTLYITKLVHQNPPSDVPGKTALLDQHHSSKSIADVTEPVPQNPPFTLFITKVVHQIPPGTTAAPDRHKSPESRDDVTELMHLNLPSSVPVTTASLSNHQSSESKADVKRPVHQTLPLTVNAAEFGHQSPPSKVPGSTALQALHHSSESKTDFIEPVEQNLPFLLYFKNLLNQNPFSNVPSTTAPLDHHHSSESKADVTEPMDQKPPLTVSVAESAHQNPLSKVHGVATLYDRDHNAEFKARFTELCHQNPPSNVPVAVSLQDLHECSESNTCVKGPAYQSPPFTVKVAKPEPQNPPSKAHVSTTLQDQHRSSESKADVGEPMDPPFVLYVTKLLNQNSSSDAPITPSLLDQHCNSDSKTNGTELVHQNLPLTVDVAEPPHQNPPSKGNLTNVRLDLPPSSESKPDIPEPMNQSPALPVSVVKLTHQNPLSNASVTTTLLDLQHSSESKVNVLELMCQYPPIKVEASEPEHQISKPVVNSTEVQTDETHGDIAELHKRIKSLNTECQSLKDKVNELETKLKHQTFKISVFNDSKVEYFTGLPNMQTFMLLLTYVSSVLPSSCSLEPTQELLLTLMKLRLNLTEELLGYLFGIQQSTVSEIFQRWTKVMVGRLQSLVLWPDREELRRSLPTCYQTTFQNCVSIVDCFEVLIEHPSQAKTWTSYKEHNTVKFLISFTPEGTISFVSKAWLGSVTNRHIIENSGFLEKLQPGDLVLSEWGFETNDHDGLYCAEVVNSSTRGCQKRLSRKEIASSRDNFQVRIHVKRLIGMLRQRYAILGSTLPLSFTNIGRKGMKKNSLAEQIVVICGALCNLCESVVPSEVSE